MGDFFQLRWCPVCRQLHEASSVGGVPFISCPEVPDGTIVRMPPSPVNLKLEWAYRVLTMYEDHFSRRTEFPKGGWMSELKDKLQEQMKSLGERLMKEEAQRSERSEQKLLNIMKGVDWGRSMYSPRVEVPWSPDLPFPNEWDELEVRDARPDLVPSVMSHVPNVLSRVGDKVEIELIDSRTFRVNYVEQHAETNFAAAAELTALMNSWKMKGWAEEAKEVEEELDFDDITSLKTEPKWFLATTGALHFFKREPPRPARNGRITGIKPITFVYEDIDEPPKVGTVNIKEGEKLNTLRGPVAASELLNSDAIIIPPGTVAVALPKVCCACGGTTIHDVRCPENLKGMVEQLGADAARKRLADPRSQFYGKGLESVLETQIMLVELRNYKFHGFQGLQKKGFVEILEETGVKAFRPGWSCSTFHNNPDTQLEFINSLESINCEVCGLARVAAEGELLPKVGVDVQFMTAEGKTTIRQLFPELNHDQHFVTAAQVDAAEREQLGWTCENHLEGFRNHPDRDSCELCGRPKPKE